MGLFTIMATFCVVAGLFQLASCDSGQLNLRKSLKQTGKQSFKFFMVTHVCMCFTYIYIFIQKHNLMNIVCFSSILVFPGNSGVGEHARLTPPLLRRNLKLQEEASSVCVFLSLQTDLVTFKVLFRTS